MDKSLYCKTIMLFCLVVCLVRMNYAESQKVNQLRKKLASTQDNHKQAELILTMADELKGSNPDSAMGYYKQVEVLAKSIKSEKQKKALVIRCLLGKAAINTIQGNFIESRKLDSIAQTMAREINSFDLEAQALLGQGSIYYHQSEYAKAQEINQQALKLARKGGSPKTLGKILTNMGTIEFILGNAKKADSLFKIPIEIAIKYKDDDLLAASYVNLGQLNLYSGNYKAAEESGLKAIEIYKRINGVDGLALCYQNLSNIYLERIDIAKAIEYNLLANKYFTILNDQVGKSCSFHNLGECYVHIGDYERALTYYLKALDLRKTMDNLKEEGGTLLSLGHLHYRLSNTGLAKKYYRQALGCFKKTNYSMGIANAYDAEANIFFEERNLDSAFYYNEKAAALYEETQSLVNLATSWLNLGKIFQMRKNFTEAEKRYQNALHTQEQAGDSLGIQQSLSLLASFYLEKSRLHPNKSAAALKELEKSTSYASRAYKIGISTKNLPSQLEAAGKLLIISESKGNQHEALHYAKIKIALADSLAILQRSDALANAEIRWKSEQKQTEINLLIKDKELQKKLLEQTLKSRTRLRILLATLVLVAFLVTLVFIQYIKNKKRKEEAEYQLHLNEMTRLKLQNITNRLSPHLLFNLLGSVASEDLSADSSSKERLRLITHLLRKSLESAEKIAIPLHEELEMVNSYLNLQASRMEGGLQFNLQFKEDLPKDVKIPAMSIQIPTENAIKHGLLPLEGPRKLTIRGTKDGSNVRIEIQDNGIGYQQSKGRTPGTGTGLKSLLQTIHVLNRKNSEHIKFSINDAPDGGTLVELLIPINFDYSV